MPAQDERIERRNPRLFYLDGTYAVLYRQGTLTVDGERMTYLILPEWAKRMHRISPSRLNYNDPHPQAGVRGIYTIKYKAQYMIPISFNPEFPAYLMTCNFKGELINIADPNMTAFQNLQRIIDSQNITIKAQQARIYNLEDMLNEMSVGRTMEKKALQRIAGISIDELNENPLFKNLFAQLPKEEKK